MTGGVLGLVGSIGIASAANNGGSRKITVQQMPSHAHDEVVYVKRDSGNTSIPPWKLYVNDRWASGGIIECNGKDAIKGSDMDTDFGFTSSVGGGQDYIPAHTAVYGWIRTA